MKYRRLALSVVFLAISSSAFATLSVPDSLIVEATGPSGAVVGFTVSVVGSVDDGGGRSNHTVTCSPASNSTFAIGITTVNCLGSEGSTGSFLVTVRDSTGPELTLPVGITVITTATSEVVTYSATAVDIVDGPVAVSCSPPSGSSFPVGTTEVACSATDAHGNTSSGGFSVVIASAPPPPGGGPNDMTVEATGPFGTRVVFDAGDEDDDSGRPGSGGCSPAPGSLFPLGATLVTCPSGTFYIVVEDTTGPYISVSGSLTVTTADTGGAAISYSAAAMDLVDGAVAVSCSPGSGAIFPIGETTITCTASDSHGNDSEATFTAEVVLLNGNPPVLTLPGNLVVEATGPGGAVATFTATALDDIDGSVPVVCTPPSGSIFPLATEEAPSTTVTCSASDSNSNTATGSFTVTVLDTTPPALTVPGDLTLEATGPDGAFVTFTVSAVDAVSGVVPVDCTHASGQLFPLGTLDVACSATDAFGNSSVASFNVDVVDTTPPDVTVPADITVEATGFSGAVVTFAASATDLVDGPLAVACTPPSGSTFALGTTTVTCSATDSHGNEGSASFEVHVVDTTPPVIVSLTASPDQLWSPNKRMAPITITAVVTDIADPAPIVRIYDVTCDEPITAADWSITGALTVDLRVDRLGNGDGREYTIHIEAIDASGNRSTGTVIVTVPHDQRWRRDR